MKNIQNIISNLERRLSQEEKDLVRYNEGYVEDALSEIFGSTYEYHKKEAHKIAFNNPSEIDDRINDYGWEHFGTLENVIREIYIEYKIIETCDVLEEVLAYYGLLYLQDYCDIACVPDDFDYLDFGTTLCDFETFERILNYLDEYAFELKEDTEK